MRSRLYYGVRGKVVMLYTIDDLDRDARLSILACCVGIAVISFLFPVVLWVLLAFSPIAATGILCAWIMRQPETYKPSGRGYGYNP